MRKRLEVWLWWLLAGFVLGLMVLHVVVTSLAWGLAGR